MHSGIQKAFFRNVSLRFYAKSKFCVCFEVHIPVVKTNVITKRLTEFELFLTEVICINLTVSKNKWAIFSVYRPPKFNITLFFYELRVSIDKATRKYDGIIIIGDINIDSCDESIKGFSSLTELCDIFCLENLIRDTTCETSNSSSSVDVKAGFYLSKYV